MSTGVIYRTPSSYPDLSVRDKLGITFPALRPALGGVRAQPRIMPNLWRREV
ncbi:MAG: hypothetical protein JNK77_02275 [Saprospiraceae bacterium]|nr:hypothetical protein [Saprospiraceae bacterium]